MTPPGNQYLQAREPWVSDRAYVLNIKPERFAELEKDLEATSTCSQAIQQIPVASRRKKMLCFVSTTKGHFTHITRSTVYYPAESGRDKLDIWNVVELAEPVRIAKIKAKLSNGKAWRAKQALAGGHVSPGAYQDLMKALKKVDPSAFSIAEKLADQSSAMHRIELTAAETNWAYQRDAAVTALEIARIPKEQLEVTPYLEADISQETTSIFDSDENMTTIEDLAILQDLDNPDEAWNLIKRQRYPAKTFMNDKTKVTILLANKLELEKQLGVDLIYFNETMKSAVFVQYKMFRGKDGEQGYRPDAQLDKEIARMDVVAAELAKSPPDESCDGYRFAPDPFFLKFCSKLLTHEGQGHVPGIYVPLSYWKRLVKDPRSRGPKGGKIVYDNTFDRRRITPTSFIDMVGRGWIGTTALQSSEIAAYLQGALQGKTGVVFAVQSDFQPDSGPAEEGF